jgi:hypothetical protein
MVGQNARARSRYIESVTRTGYLPGLSVVRYVFKGRMILDLFRTRVGDSSRFDQVIFAEALRQASGWDNFRERHMRGK